MDKKQLKDLLVKKNILFLSLLFLSVTVFSQTVDNVSKTESSYFPLPRVDKRVELLSIIFRLAGNREYNNEVFKSYTSDIHAHFDKHKDHALIKFTRDIRDKNMIGFDAVMKMAIYLGQPPTFNPIVPFTSDVPDKRWGQENAINFLKLLQQFYIDAKCEEFFKNHEELYRTSQERYKTVYDALDINWYNQYYGAHPKGSFNIIPGLGNGGGNYGFQVILPDGKEEAYAIMATSLIDNSNNPIYDVNINLPTLIHEFNHSYVNDILSKHEKEFENPGVKLFNIVQEIMRNQAYTNWKTMMNESLVRASVIRYLLKHNTDKTIATKQLISEFNRGFFWMKGLVECLAVYEKNRNKYPTLESYMPVLVNFYDGIAKDCNLMFEIRE